MNQKELNEIRRRFKPDKTNIKKVYGCYVNNAREIVSYMDMSMGIMAQEEGELYLALMKKALSGTLGKNLVDVAFSTQQVAGSEEHKLLQSLRISCLEDRESLEALCGKIAQSLDMGDSNYLILLAADTYDVPFKTGDEQDLEDNSDTVFRYFICCICPVKAAALELKYSTEEKCFRSSSTGAVAASPVLGFMFPAFDGRQTNIYNALYYTKSTDELHQEFMDAVFASEPLMSVAEQRNAFDNALMDALAEDCSFDVVQGVQEQLRQRIAEHKESKEPETLEITTGDMGQILKTSGAPEERAEAFKSECEKRFGTDASIKPANIIRSNTKFEVKTPEVTIAVDPEFSYLIETRIIDGRRYILIPADEGVEVEGVEISSHSREE